MDLSTRCKYVIAVSLSDLSTTTTEPTRLLIGGSFSWLWGSGKAFLVDYR